MQNQQIREAYVLLSIPAETIKEAGFGTESMLQITAERGSIRIEAVSKADKSEFVCDGDCDNCPVSQTDCDGDCAACPCNAECE